MSLIEKYNEIIQEVDFFVTCDLETTGTDHMKCDWITGSFGKIEKKSLKTVQELELTSRPVNHWDEDARKHHRFSLATAMEFDYRAESLKKLIAWLPERSKFAFVCHANPEPWIEFGKWSRGRMNSHIDLAMIKWDFFMQDRFFDFHKCFDESKVISTQTIAREYWNLAKELNLKEICDILGVPLEGKHHEARFDRLGCERLLRKYINEQGFSTLRNRHPELDSAIPEIQENQGVAEQQRLGI